MSGDNDIIPAPEAGEGPASQSGYRAAPDYRQIQSPTEGLEPWRLPNSGAADRATTLANSFKEFEGDAFSLANKLNARAGAQAGSAAGIDPNFQPKTGLSAITAYGSAYDAAAHVAYINKTQTSVEAQLSAIEADTQGDPAAFTLRAQGVANGTLKNAPAMYVPELANIMQARIAAGQARTREQAIVTARSDAWESYTSTVDSRITSALETAAELPADQQAAIVQQTRDANRVQLDALVQARAITPEKSAILQQQFIDRMTGAVHGQYIDGVVSKMMDVARAGDVDAADKLVQQYVQDPANSAADKSAVAQHYLEQSERNNKLQSQLHANDLAGIGQSLVQGAYGQQVEPAIHQLYKIGAINPEMLHSLMDQSMRNQVAAVGDDADNQLIDAALHGGQKLDPANKDIVNATDTYFKTHIAINGVVPGSDAYAVGAAAFVKGTNIVPPSVRSTVRIGLMSDDPIAAAKAAQLADRLQQANPQAALFDDNEPHLSAFAGLINENLKAGMSAQQAFSVATTQQNATPAIKEKREENYGKALKGGTDNNTALQNAMNKAQPGLFSSAPPAPVAMQADYSTLVRQLYGQTGNLSQAQDIAAKQLQRTWGLSKVNGSPALTKWPIPDDLVQTVRADIATAAKSAGITTDPSGIHLTPGPLTDQTQGRVWTLTHTDANGVEDILFDQNNRPVQYQLPSQDFAKQRQTLIAQKLDAARKQRDVERSMDANRSQVEQRMADYYLSQDQTPGAR